MMTDHQDRTPLRVGFILLDQFTLAGFAGMVDALRLAADTGGGSRQIHASWTIMTEDARPCRSSCGAVIAETSPFLDPLSFDYVAVCGGNGYQSGSTYSPSLIAYLQEAMRKRIRLIGICTGTFALAKSNLIGDRTVCVNWNVVDVFQRMFPAVNTRTDMLFVDEGDLITCAGSTAAIDLGLYLISRHCGTDKARQAVRHMILQSSRPAKMPQPHFAAELRGCNDVRVQQAVHFMTQRIDEPPSVDAAARYVGVSSRQLERIFHQSVGVTPKAMQLRLRLRYAQWLLLSSHRSIMDIAFDCGFADAAHFSREYRGYFHTRPSDLRKQLKSNRDAVAQNPLFDGSSLPEPSGS
jgi:transcriptional regulator GlxA family with amidase domain